MPDKTDNTETKIVKADKSASQSADANASKVQIKAVDIALMEAQKQRAKKSASSAAPAKKQAAAKPAAFPIGKPMPKSSSSASSSNADSLPFGTPVPKKAVPKGAVPMKKSESLQNMSADTAEAASVETEALKEDAKSVKTEAKAKTSKSVSKPAGAESAADNPDAAANEKSGNVNKETEGASKTGKNTASKKASKSESENKTEAAEPDNSDIKESSGPDSKAEVPAEKPQPERVPVDYTPGIGIKIIRKASDEPKQERKPSERRNGRNDRSSADSHNSGAKKDKKQSDEKRTPKEFTGRKPSSSKDKVNAFNNAPSENQGGRRQNKNKKDKRDYLEEMPSDLSRNIKKKHSKYKEKVDLGPTEEETLIQEAVQTGSVLINVPITVAGFCEQIERSTSDVIMALMKMGIMANINQNLDEETAVLLGMELGVSIMVNKNEEIEQEEGIDRSEDRESDLLPRAPIVTVMGHVDHGKTSLLDAIRKTNVTAGEAGGITQAIGASEISVNGQHIVFLDTPGHEAFTAMRARGAHVTDIAVLVVAADDSVMPQTIESISHAKAAGVPIIVAINKMDKPGANPDLVKNDLSKNGVLVEDWGGNVISVPVSAKTGMGIDKLLEMILLQAEMLELKANPNRRAMGTVIEAKLDKNRGPVASLLVMNGTLQAGASIVAGTACGRIRVMTNPKGENVKKAGPARAVEITGLTDVPEAGDEFFMVRDEKTAREIAENRRLKLRNDMMAKSSAISLEKLFSQLEEGEVKDLNLIIKADVMGSVGALEASLEKLHNENVRVRIIHSGVGTINESDITLAETSNAVIIGFNVRPTTAVSNLAESKGVEIRTYRIIYEIIEDIEAAMKGMLDPEFKEVILGKAEIRTTYKISNVGTIAGAYITEGKVTRNAKVRIVRDGIVIHEGEISSLKRFKDDAREVATGFECGIGIEKFNDIKEGDVIEAFEMQEVKRS